MCLRTIWIGAITPGHKTLRKRRWDLAHHRHRHLHLALDLHLLDDVNRHLAHPTLCRTPERTPECTKTHHMWPSMVTHTEQSKSSGNVKLRMATLKLDREPSARRRSAAPGCGAGPEPAPAPAPAPHAAPGGTAAPAPARPSTSRFQNSTSKFKPFVFSGTEEGKIHLVYDSR